MPLWLCNFDGCHRVAVRDVGDCVLCNRHLCSDHLKPDFHHCPPWEVRPGPSTNGTHLLTRRTLSQDVEAYFPAAGKAEKCELTELISRINIDALAARASHLRQGAACSISPLRYDAATRASVMGGMNYHVDVCFEDGIKWIARIRRFNATSPPPALRDFIMQSEVATLKFLEQTNVPAPAVYDFAPEHPNNPVGVGYILMEKVPGESLKWSITSPKQREKVMDQLADVFVELHKYPFPLLGSLDIPGEPHVGPFARESHVDFTSSSKMCTSGPFASFEEYHTTSLKLILDQILRKEAYSQRSVDAYLIHRFLLDLIPQVLSSAQVDGKFYLKHADDKGDHIMVDEHFNLTGIIDWEWAHTAPLAQAFNSPIGLLPVSDFYEGNNDLGHDEVVFAQLLEGKGHAELARCVWNGRLQHRFAFCCGYNLADWDGFLGLFRGLREALSQDAGLDWEQWRPIALQRYRSDPGLETLLAGEGDQ